MSIDVEAKHPIDAEKKDRRLLNQVMLQSTSVRNA